MWGIHHFYYYIFVNFWDFFQKQKFQLILWGKMGMYNRMNKEGSETLGPLVKSVHNMPKPIPSLQLQKVKNSQFRFFEFFGVIF